MVDVKVDSEYWDDYRMYAESHGTSAEGLLNEYIEVTVDRNRKRIQKYREGIKELRKRLDAEEAFVITDGVDGKI